MVPRNTRQEQKDKSLRSSSNTEKTFFVRANPSGSTHQYFDGRAITSFSRQGGGGTVGQRPEPTLVSLVAWRRQLRERMAQRGTRLPLATVQYFWCLCGALLRLLSAGSLFPRHVSHRRTDGIDSRLMTSILQGSQIPDLHDLYDLCDLYDLFDLAHVAGWEPCDLHDLRVGACFLGWIWT